MKLRTNRKQKIMELLSDGYSTKEIAEILGVSKNTVESHKMTMLIYYKARNGPHMIKLWIENNKQYELSRR